MTMKMRTRYSIVSIEIVYYFSIREIPIETFLRLLIYEIKTLRQEVAELRDNGEKGRRRITDHASYNLIIKELKPEMEINGLGTYSDGTIRYHGQVIQMRDQLNDLCRMFMSRPNQLVLSDEIREEIIRAERRERTRFSTIAKYVSELHGLLKPCFGKDLIFNHKKEGWRFVP